MGAFTRRFVVTALLFLFVAQSSGAALSATPLQSIGAHVDFGSIFDPIFSAVEGSQIVALVTGAENRYAAIHAPAPRIVRSDSRVDAVALLRREHGIRPTVRIGVPEHVTMPPLSVLDSRHPRLDPLAMRRSNVTPSSRQYGVQIAPTLTPLHPPITAAGPRTGSSRIVGPARQQQKAGMQPMTSIALGAGIEPWWTYEARTIPGIGKAMLNVGTGNMVVSAVDVDVHEQGLDLAFQRVYNTQSQHDYNQEDGGDRAIFGNYWTNNFDANMVYDSVANTITVYDIDGTPCTYIADPNNPGQWLACTGVYAKLAPTDSSDCTYTWTKPNGTVYWFYADASGGGCGLPQAKKGHLQEIVGRNNNNTITFTYSYDGQGKGSENVTEIDAKHSDGHILKMLFGPIAGTSINELAQIQRPGNSSNNTLEYLYDTSGNLVEVDRPGNDASATLPETYAYVPGTSYLQEACGPRCTLSTRANPNGNPTDGSSLVFTYNSNNWVNSWLVYGVLNIDPGDGHGVIQQLQPNGQTWSNVYGAYFVYGTGNRCTYATAGTTTMCDTDGHSTIWTADSNSRVTQTQAWTGSAEGVMLVTNSTWDASNNHTGSIDASGYETDYAYSNGDTIAVAQPRPATGQDRPTSLYTYDSNHNLLSYCDPVYSSQNGLDWNSGSYTGSGCPGGTGTTHYQWTAPSDGSEPFGRIYQAWTACFNAGCVDHFNSISEPGYHVIYAYTTYGLPYTVTGDTIQQPAGSRSPTQTFGYDSHGNLTSYTNGGGTWILNYDSLNRLTSRVDPDPQNPTSYSYYNPDGSVYLTETPYQHSLSKGHAFTYDADGDVLTQTVHRNGTQGTITKAYDGLDRLVEVQQPYSSADDVLTYPWITRYFYDLSEGNSVSFNRSPNYSAYGNLFATEEFLPPGTGTGGAQVTYSGSQVTGNYAFLPLKGTQYDALDRATGSYTIVNGANALATTTYDGAGQEGLPSQECQPPIPQHTLCKNLFYDNDSRLTSVTYLDSSSSNRTYTYDAAGHRLSASTVADGTQEYWYDLEGRVTNSWEPNHGTSRAKYTHEFYADGKLKQLDVASSALSRNNGLFTYSYTVPGQLGTEGISNTSQGGSGFATLNFTYTPAGRLSQRTETVNGWNTSPSTSMSYDAFGQLSAVTYPYQNQISNYTYNPEGDLLSFGNQNSGPYQAFAYTIRGEMLAAGTTSNWPNGYAGSYLMANGTQVQSGSGAGVANFSANWDDRMGVMLSLATNTGYSNPSGASFAYDSAGRETGSGSNSCSDAPSCDTASSTGNVSSYDVDNHTLEETQSWQSSTQGGNFAAANISVYDWGPTDHPIRVGSADSTTSTPPPDTAATYDTLHWDGDQLIFSTNAGGNVDDIKVGATGDITPQDTHYQGITFWDRGPGGAVVYCHNGNGSAGGGGIADVPFATMWSISPCMNNLQIPAGFPTSIMWFNGSISGKTPQGGKPRSGGVGQGSILGMYRPDGITDGANTIQGVRTTDAMSGTWTTPDAFAGLVDDPKSEKSYVWNGNNPMTYTDPSGYAIGGSGFAGGLGTGGWVGNCSNCGLLPTDAGGLDSDVVAATVTGRNTGNPQQEMMDAAGYAYGSESPTTTNGPTRPGTQTPEQLSENAGNYLQSIPGVTVTPAPAPTGAYALAVSFNNGFTGSMMFTNQEITISLNNAHGEEIVSAFTEVRWHWEGGGYGKLFQGGYPVYRMPNAGITKWLPLTIGGDDQRNNP
jgi:YD repeat-containing protein